MVRRWARRPLMTVVRRRMPASSCSRRVLLPAVMMQQVGEGSPEPSRPSRKALQILQVRNTAYT